MNDELKKFSPREIEQGFKNLSKEAKRNNQQYEYHKAVSAYYEKNQIVPPTYFDFPFDNFTVIKGEIFFTGPSLLPFSSDLRRAFEKLGLPFSSDGTDEQVLTRKLKTLLMQQKNKLNTCLNEYKLKSGQNFPLNEYFKYKGNLCTTYNGKPYIIQSSFMKIWSRIY